MHFRALTLIFLVNTAHFVAAQDTIRLGDRVIRVGELEWDTHKDWTGKGFTIAENPDLYGEDVRIYIGFHKSRTVKEIVFGYFKSDTTTGDVEFLAHGPARYYTVDGKLAGKRTYVQGSLNGVMEDYYDYGNPSAKGYYKDDKLEGEYLTYYETGDVECKMSFVNDQENGPRFCYHRNGMLETKVFYTRGLADGPDSSWYDNGTLESVYFFRNGMEQDTGFHFHSNGTPFTARLFLDGRLADVLYVKNKEGKDLMPGDFQGGNGRLNVYSDDGKLKEIVIYRDGWVKRIKRLL